MAQPTQSAVHAVDVPLTNISTAYIQSETNFIASKVFPIVPVLKQSNKYYTYDKNSWFRDEAAQRADSTESVGSGYGLSTATYSCDVFAIHKDIGVQARNNADAGINLDRDATMFVTQRLLLRREIQWAADYFANSIWGTSTTPAALWSAYTTSDPISDVETGKSTILAATGFLPNTLVLGYDTFRYLRHHPDIIDRIKYTTNVLDRNVTETNLANLFEVANVYVARSVKATNVEGETAAYAMVHGKHALLCYVAPNPGLLTPSAGYIFSWGGVAGDMPGAQIGITRFNMPAIKSDRVEGEIAFDDKLVATDLGYFFNSVVS
jgi:hypothetical protein